MFSTLEFQDGFQHLNKLTKIGEELDNSSKIEKWQMYANLK